VKSASGVILRSRVAYGYHRYDCSGLLTPDTFLDENDCHTEVSDDQTARYLYPLDSSARMHALCSTKATAIPKQPIRLGGLSPLCAVG
jgi:hypothetical protein